MTRDERSDYFLTLLRVFCGGAAAFNAALIAFFNMCALIPPHLTPRNITRRHKKEMIPPASCMRVRFTPESYKKFTRPPRRVI